MSLRARLVIAFFLLSVVPLAAITAISYAASARALREAAEGEADLLAAELGQRMQLVTAQLRDRVEHVMDLSELQAEILEAGELQAAEAEVESAAMMDALEARMADALGEAAILLNNVEITGRFQGRRGGGRGRRGDGGGREGGMPEGGPPQPSRGGGEASPALPPAPPVVPPPDRPAASLESALVQGDRLQIDLEPIRRELFRQMVPDGGQNLTPDERRQIGAQVSARMLGIEEGIRIGAAELQKRAEEARRQAEIAAAGGSAGRRAGTAAATRRAEVTGSRLGVTLERDGEVLSRISAEIDVPNVLATVFSTTRRDRGEVPFAVASDGRIHTQAPEDQAIVEALGDVVRPDGPATARVNDWVVVTTTNPAGIGMKLGIARPVGDSLADLRRTTATNAGLGLALIGLALVGIVPLAGRLTRDLESLGGGVKRLAGGDYRARVPVKRSDEVGELAHAFNQMAADVERHQQSAVERERIRRELELGRQIQNDMLPHEPLRLGFAEINGVSVPAREVGGDFFNYFQLPSGDVALLVGDVSGKGVGAALLMANLQAALRIRLSLGQELPAIADEIDRDIEANAPGPLYATLFIGMLDLAGRRLRYVNAGHHPQFVLRRGVGLERMASTGLPAGLFAGRGYVEHTVPLAAGDVIFFYTDGCVEAEAPSGDFFGTGRLEAVLRESSLDSAAGVLARVEAAVAAFRGGRELDDDATMMAVRVE
jgi:serine phosphatase RsbU (regulator of sigma subunit)